MREEVRKGVADGRLDWDSISRILENLLKLQRLRKKRAFWNIVIVLIGTITLATAANLVNTGIVHPGLAALYCAYFVYSMVQSLKILWDLRVDYRADQDLADFLEERLSFKA